MESITQVPSRHRHQYDFNKDGETVCIFCKAPYVHKEKKHYKPRSTAYITDEKVKEILGNEPPRHALCIETIYTLGLRAHEALGDPKNPDKPGIRPMDIDVESRPYCNHTLRIWRKRNKFKIMPVSDVLYRKLQAHIKEYRIKTDERVFPYSRVTVYGWLAKYGQCVDTRYKIGIHVLRRSMGKEFRRRGGRIEDLQKVYSHEKMQQTMEYIGEDEETAMKNFAELNQAKTGVTEK